MKYNVAKDELKIKGKNGLYCFLPYEKLDDNNKAVFKVGMTTQDLANRIENYHSYYPMGVYIVFFLAFNIKKIPADLIKKKEQLKTETEKFKAIEKDLFNLIVKNSGVRMKFPSRPSISWTFPSEWFYTDVNTLKLSFEEINKKYGGKLHSFHLNRVNKQYAKNLADKRPKYDANIIYFV